MTVSNIRTRDNYQVYADQLFARQSFDAGVNVRGRKVEDAAGIDTGRMPLPWAETFRDQEMEIKFIVWSYDTPIAWLLDTGEWVVPQHDYSPTTTKHLGTVRRAIASLGDTAHYTMGTLYDV